MIRRAAVAGAGAGTADLLLLMGLCLYLADRMQETLSRLQRREDHPASRDVVSIEYRESQSPWGWLKVGY